MKTIAVLLWLTLAACSNTTSQSQDTTPRGPTCGSDVDCTGGRVCWSGTCQDPAVVQGNP